MARQKKDRNTLAIKKSVYVYLDFHSFVILFFFTCAKNMKITIHTFTGKEIPIEVRLTYTVERVKSLIKYEGIDITNKRLFMKDTKLEDDHTLESYNVEDSSVIFLMPESNTFLLTIKTSDHRTFKIPATSCDTIGNIKHTIQKMEGIKKTRQILSYKNGVLDDNHLIEWIDDAKDKSVLHMDIITSFPIDIQTPCEKLSVTVEETDTILDLKKKIEADCGIAIEYQILRFNGAELEDDHIVDYYKIDKYDLINVSIKPHTISLLVKTSTGKSIEVSAPNTATIEMVKKQIQEQEGIPIECQILDNGDARCDNSRILESLSLRNGTTLDLTILSEESLSQSYEVEIHSITGKIFKLHVHSFDPVDHLKSLIGEHEGISPEYFRLVFASKSLDGEKTLAEYGINNDCKIYYYIRFGGCPTVPVFIDTPDGIIITVKFCECSVNDIFYNIHSKTGIPPEDQQLFYNGKAINSGDDISKMCIPPYSHILLVPKPHVFKNRNIIYVKPPSGSKFIIESEMSDTISSVKTKIQEMTGLKPEEYKLVFEDQCLDDEKTLNDYCITSESTLCCRKI